MMAPDPVQLVWSIFYTLTILMVIGGMMGKR